MSISSRQPAHKRLASQMTASPPGREHFVFHGDSASTRRLSSPHYSWRPYPAAAGGPLRRTPARFLCAHPALSLETLHRPPGVLPGGAVRRRPVVLLDNFLSAHRQSIKGRSLHAFGRHLCRAETDSRRPAAFAGRSRRLFEARGLRRAWRAGRKHSRALWGGRLSRRDRSERRRDG